MVSVSEASRSIDLLAVDVIQVPDFARPGVTTNDLRVAMGTIIRVLGAVSLWRVEIIMQLHVYAIYGYSKRVVALNLVLFAGSIIGFLCILIFNHSRRAAVIAALLSTRQFLGFAPYGIIKSTVQSPRKDTSMSLHTYLSRDNILYFFGGRNRGSPRVQNASGLIFELDPRFSL
ncbi:hypothetical protein B0H10DRAFT_2229922 [Mycena sp. CBHHK59/15]|nr:hypothetical protein B0H10DRAFT_2229922 [Mycena sp. CBHHK59/15]